MRELRPIKAGKQLGLDKSNGDLHETLVEKCELVERLTQPYNEVTVSDG